MKSGMTPQRKKALSYAKDGRNTLAEARSKAHKAITLRKAMANRALRRAEAVATAATARDLDADAVVARSGRRSWRKTPDAPLAVYVSARLGSANLAHRKSDLLEQGKKSAKVRRFVLKGPLFNGLQKRETE
ncbi:MAG TPA: hypothetical protein VF800_21295 [Telluria sp.]|jgi:hypothetical protein